MSDRGARARGLWRVAFTVVLAVSAYVLFSPSSGVPADVPVSDKVIHGGLFAVLAVTALLAGVPRWSAAVGLLGYAVVSEVLQAVLPIGRDGDVLDALADAVGVLVGLAVVASVDETAPRTLGKGGFVDRFGWPRSGATSGAASRPAGDESAPGRGRRQRGRRPRRPAQRRRRP